MSEALLPTAVVSHPARMPRRTRPEAGAAARGIMLALALSSVAWIGVALLVPRLW
jgi:hypothetical protein